MWIVKQINEREIMNEQLASKIRSQLSGGQGHMTIGRHHL
jgi:hypothetical protein